MGNEPFGGDSGRYIPRIPIGCQESLIETLNAVSAVATGLEEEVAEGTHFAG
jgi:hypothetical protein